MLRGFLNKKLSLFDIEEISDVIEARNETERRFYGQGDGKVIKAFTEDLRAELVDLGATVQAYLDFEELEVRIILTKQILSGEKT